jgi:hypothetical protein
MSGNSHVSVMREFAVCEGIRPDIDNPVWHCPLPIPPGEKLEPWQWAEISEEFMRKMEFL